jgi:hypothetical protein
VISFGGLTVALDAAPQAGGTGFAYYILGGVFALGVLVLLARWVSSKPKRRRRP